MIDNCFGSIPITRIDSSEVREPSRQKPEESSAHQGLDFHSVRPDKRPSEMSVAELAADISQLVPAAFRFQALHELEKGLAVSYSSFKSEDFAYPSTWSRAMLDLTVSYWRALASKLKPAYEKYELISPDTEIPLEPTTSWAKTPVPDDAEIKLLTDQRNIIRDRIIYLPLSLAAWNAQTSEATLRSWIKKRVSFNKMPIQSYISPTTSEIYVSERSIKAMGDRFVEWPSGKPAGPIVLGDTRNRSGFIGLPHIARTTGISVRTLSHWATEGEIPTAGPLRVIRCTTSGRLYIGESDAAHLKHLQRPTGRRRGPKPKSPRP